MPHCSGDGVVSATGGGYRDGKLRGIPWIPLLALLRPSPTQIHKCFESQRAAEAAEAISLPRCQLGQQS